MDKIYIIQVNINEFEKEYKYISDNLNDCVNHIMDYKNWYDVFGSCTILEMSNTFNTLRKMYYRCGELDRIEA